MAKATSRETAETTEIAVEEETTEGEIDAPGPGLLLIQEEVTLEAEETAEEMTAMVAEIEEIEIETAAETPTEAGEEVTQAQEVMTAETKRDLQEPGEETAGPDPQGQDRLPTQDQEDPDQLLKRKAEATASQLVAKAKVEAEALKTKK